MAVTVRPGHLFGALAALFLAACEVTSGQVRTDEVTCAPVTDAADYRGAKPTWGVFGEVEVVTSCNAPKQTQHKFRLSTGFASSQISNSDEVVFDQITERVFRELMRANQAFAPLAGSAAVKQVADETRPVLYVVNDTMFRPLAYFVLNDGYPAADKPFAWSQVHFGVIQAPGTMTAAEFEDWLAERIREFRNTGGDYTRAFSADR